MSQTIYDKIWNEHLVHEQEDGTSLLFVDRHLIHEVTSPQAFEGLRNTKRKVRQPKLTLAVADHNVPTTDRSKGISDEESKIQVDTLDTNLIGEGRLCKTRLKWFEKHIKKNPKNPTIIKSLEFNYLE